MAKRSVLLRRVARDPKLRRLQMSFIGFAFAEHATWLAMLVYAFDRGGVGESGLVAMIQLLPAMIVAPFAAYAGDRFRTERVLSFGYALQSVSMAATALSMWADLPIVAYVAATFVASSITFSRPVMGAVLPEITRTPSDLVAANVVTGFIEYVGMFLGPLVGGLVLAHGSPAAVFAICAVATANSAILSLRLSLESDAKLVSSSTPRDVLAGVWEGMREVKSHKALRSLMVLMVIGGLVRGATDVLMVLYAEVRLDGGGGAAGLLGVGMGVGAVLGAVGSAGLMGRALVSSYLVYSAVLFAVAFIVLSGVEVLIIGMVLFACFGLGESLLRVTSSVGTQRLSPDAFLARIFGVAEGLQMAAMALGSFALSVIVRAMGLGPALVTMGSVVTLTMMWNTLRFRRAGGDVPPPPAELIDRLLLDDVFRHLPGLALARLAERICEERFEAGTAVITEGESGDRYYLITSGRVTVTVAGEFVREMGPGLAFGEIALVRDLPRTATVTCAVSTDFLVVERDDFLEVVVGHRRTLAAASDVATAFMSDERS